MHKKVDPTLDTAADGHNQVGSSEPKGAVPVIKEVTKKMFLWGRIRHKETALVQGLGISQFVVVYSILSEDPSRFFE